MFRQFLATIVASVLLISCNGSGKSGNKSEKSWKDLYKQAYTNHDYPTAIVALNQLIIEDSANANYYDSLATYYLKKTQNFYAGRVMVDKGLALNANNHQLLEYRSLLLISEGKFVEARTILEKAYGLSKLNKYQYMIATTYANEKNYVEFERIVDELIAKDIPHSDQIEAMIDNTNSQMVEVKAMCYLGKAKLSKDVPTMMKYLDNTLKIQPDYQEALYMLENIQKKNEGQQPQ